MLILQSEFQCPSMPGTGLEVCVGMVWWFGEVYKPILVFNLPQYEQKETNPAERVIRFNNGRQYQ